MTAGWQVISLFFLDNLSSLLSHHSNNTRAATRQMPQQPRNPVRVDSFCHLLIRFSVIIYIQQ